MRNLAMALAALTLVAAPAAPSLAREKTRWSYDGKQYRSYQECRAAKKKSRNRAAVVGAVASGGVAAASGANLGETALIAGAGALAGGLIGDRVKKC